MSRTTRLKLLCCFPPGADRPAESVHPYDRSQHDRPGGAAHHPQRHAARVLHLHTPARPGELTHNSPSAHAAQEGQGTELRVRADRDLRIHCRYVDRRRPSAKHVSKLPNRYTRFCVLLATREMPFCNILDRFVVECSEGRE